MANPYPNQRASPQSTHNNNFDEDSVSEEFERSTDVKESLEDSNNVHEVYRSLVSRRVDLVGDYAGNELFLIDGDSLLLRCFEDEKLDFHQGMQLLHAAYNVEFFLKNLMKRKCKFHIVFFNSNSTLCIPVSADSNSKSKYLLARTAIIRHLSDVLPRSHPHIRVRTYDAWHSESFITDLQKSPPYFIMTHDGAQVLNLLKAREQKKSEPARQPATWVSGLPRDMKPKQQKMASRDSPRLAFRQMILFFVGRNISVALINELNFQDTKIITEVIEAHSRELTKYVPVDAEVHEHSESTSDISKYLDQLRDFLPALSERQLLVVLVVASLLQNPPAKISESQLVVFCSRFLLHQALLVILPLRSRMIRKTSADAQAQAFLSHVSSTAVTVLEDPAWHTPTTCNTRACDIIDFIDGRLFLHLGCHTMQPDEPATTALKIMEAAVIRLVGPAWIRQAERLSEDRSTSLEDRLERDHQITATNFAVMPFSNAVFDKHLKSVQIQTGATHQAQSVGAHKVFKEISHWHNSKALLIRKGPVLDPKDAFWAARRNQRYMAEMQKYAASLTNAVGKILEPQAIFVQPSTPTQTADGTPSSSKGKTLVHKGKFDKAKGGGAKASSINASKNAMLETIAANSAKKAEASGQKRIDSWREVSRTLASADPLSRYSKAQAFLHNLRREEKILIGAEVELYMGNCLVEYWIEMCTAGKQFQHLHVAAAIWNHMRAISSYSKVTKPVSKAVTTILHTLGLPPVPELVEDPVKRDLAFAFSLPKNLDLSVKMSPKTFLLLNCGPYLERSFNSSPDKRVDFQPDEWQKKVLDSIDANQSVFVVAPTSAGKTFISFYAMHKVLEADDDGVLVYVAPTKALVNQIAAEIQARYSKSFKHGGKSVWAIHTRDHRVNNCTGCQVLVTVPHILQIMLLTPSNARSWSQRVKRIIFDEVHTIGQADDGVVWEQLLLMSPCPIIGLSATVGNPEDFSQWLASTQQAIGNQLVTVQHPYRYSDLRKYYHIPPKQFKFTGLPDSTALGGLSLDDSPSLHHIHPVAALVDKSRGIPEDLSLEPRDCYQLWQAMKQVAVEPFTIPEDLNPEVALPEKAQKTDILKWERSLKVILQQWLDDIASPYDRLLRSIERSFRDVAQEVSHVTLPGLTSTSTREFTENSTDYIASTLSLLCRLQAKGALPAIIFNYDRLKCEKHAQDILEQLQCAENEQKKSGVKWGKKLEKWEEWKQFQEKQDAKAGKACKAKSNKKARGEHDDSEKVSKADLQRDSASKDDDKWERFDPQAPLTEYSFADYTKLQPSEVDEYIRRLRYQDVQPWLIEALRRGVGVHHAGMPRSYRTCVEVLFRKQFLRVVIATGTLALGINMPCKTVVFSGDSVYLTALNYRQCAGRAGRRGFDLLGNVVFHGIPREKICRLISSRLPDLNGHFPITTSLVLRLFTLMHDSSYSPYSVQTIDSLLSQPRLYMGGESFKDQTMHHLRFSIEYLRRQNLLSSDGAPLNFAGLVSHLYYTENSSFAFHALLKEGYFNDLCAMVDKDEDGTLVTLMLVMAHLFHRTLCRQSVIETKVRSRKPCSSIVFLPPLPAQAAIVLADHNRQTLKVYETYVQTFIHQHVKSADDTLPLSGLKFGGSSESTGDDDNYPQSIRSSFVALSGHDDTFTSIHDLCTTVRSGVFLEEAVIPYMPCSEELEAPINAWLYDFYRHGDIQALQDANGIRKSDVWFLLNDCSLVLATIVTSLSNFLKVDVGDDVDIIDVRASGDQFEEAQEDKADEKEEPIVDGGLKPASRSVKQENVKKKVKTKVSDSLDDDAEAEEEAEDNSRDGMKSSRGSKPLQELADAMSSWDIEKDGGLVNVLKAFQKLRTRFDGKFKAMWA